MQLLWRHRPHRRSRTSSRRLLQLRHDRQRQTTVLGEFAPQATQEQDCYRRTRASFCGVGRVGASLGHTPRVPSGSVDDEPTCPPQPATTTRTTPAPARRCGPTHRRRRVGARESQGHRGPEHTRLLDPVNDPPTSQRASAGVEQFSRTGVRLWLLRAKRCGWQSAGLRGSWIFDATDCAALGAALAPRAVRHGWPSLPLCAVVDFFTGEEARHC